MKLRELRFDDSVAMLAWLSDEEASRFFAGDGTPVSARELETFIFSALYTDGDVYRALADEEDGFIGLAALKQIDQTAGSAEFAIALLPQATGKGYAAAAADELLAYGFHRLGLRRVYMYTLAENSRTVRFNETYGFLPQPGPFAALMIRGKEYALKWYGMTKEQFMEMRGHAG